MLNLSITFSSDAKIVAKSAKYIYDNFKPDIIDISFIKTFPLASFDVGG